MARVFTVEIGDDAVAYPYEVMQSVNVANDIVDGTPILVVWAPGTASPLDGSLTANGRDVGTVAAYARELGGETLTFRYEDNRIIDEGTGSGWDVLGQAVSGPLAGKQLEPVVGINHFWFSWAAFKPETRIYSPDSTGEPDAVEPEPTETVMVDQLPADVEIRVYQGEDRLGGETVLLSELLAQGKPVVLHLWAGLCPICRGEMPDVQAAYDSYREDVLLVGLDVGTFTGLGNEQDARALTNELGITFPTGTTPDATVMSAYEVLGVPTSLFFAPDGTLVKEWTGPLSEEQFSKMLDELLNTSS
jgi:thiol-disulfide isomerase/thioredoxin